MMGRPSKFNDARCGAIVRRLRAGATRKAAAEAGGVADATVRGWLERGAAEPEGPFREFAAAVQQAEAAVEAEMAAVLRETGKGYDAAETVRTTKTETTASGAVIETVTETTVTKRIRDWRASESWLKRRRRDEWGDNVTQDVTLHEDADAAATLNSKLDSLAARLAAEGVPGEPDAGGSGPA